MLFFDKKASEVEELFIEFFETIDRVLKEFRAMLFAYFKVDKVFKEEAWKVHNLEHDADVIRRKIEIKLSEGAFLPIYREDYITLAELVDRIANKAEATSDYVVLTRPQIPDFLLDGLHSLIDASIKTYTPMIDGLKAFQNDMGKVMEVTQKIGDLEQEVDQIQWDVTKKLFKSDLDLAAKLHLKGLIDSIADISDRIEDAAERFEVMLVKRRI
jgi:predicted phosphate transport protein (TIGR00153 family)